MLQPNAVASAETFTMLAACVVGIGFMVRFLVALAGEGKGMRVGVKRVHYVTEETGELARHRGAEVSPAAHLALGVLRITSALTSNLGREGRRTATDRRQVVVLAGPGGEHESATERIYRSS